MRAERVDRQMDDDGGAVDTSGDAASNTAGTDGVAIGGDGPAAPRRSETSGANTIVKASPRFHYDFETLPSGEIIWNASLVLLHYFQSLPADTFRGKRILELGSGLGHLGFGLAKLGAHVVLSEQAKCIPHLHESLAEMVRTDGVPSGDFSVVELEWGEEGWSNCELGRDESLQPFDFIIAAELVYVEETFELLIWTWQRLCMRDTVIYSIFMNRPWSWGFFVQLHDAGGFEVNQLEAEKDFDPLGLEEIHMHRISLAAQSDD
eukprot:TRINITY_DN56100_c0_g1_i1.p1 TRINITY_DN56100_c0_g1~~TRINITY_DN56100_c0_g1_i1.p1  ORF type:complete len:263 (+),score=52.74 TRINITY_DN56100_c0_g1_i1:110-898(+)